MAVAKSKSAAREIHEQPDARDAVELLKADHKEVAEMFEQFKSGDLDEDAMEELAQKICKALSIHAQIEEEIFYPAAREALDEEDQSLLDEAEVEHGSIKDLVAAVEAQEDDLFNAQVKVMGEWVTHHVKEEEGEMFPKLQKTDMDMEEIGARLAERKEELMAEEDDETEETEESDENEENDENDD